jgi:hypothetical protein
MGVTFCPELTHEVIMRGNFREEPDLSVAGSGFGAIMRALDLTVTADIMDAQDLIDRIDACPLATGLPLEAGVGSHPGSMLLDVNSVGYISSRLTEIREIAVWARQHGRRVQWA